MCGRGSGITAAATKGLLGSADVADTTVLELVAAMEELGAVLVGDCTASNSDMLDENEP